MILFLFLFFCACTGDHGEESFQDQLKLKSGEMEEEKINGVGRELVGDDTEPPRGECESIVHPENPDGDVEVSLCFVVIVCAWFVYTCTYYGVTVYVCIIGTWGANFSRVLSL